jgi:hypothetical protein
MHGMYRHQDNRKRECLQKQGGETSCKHVKACQQENLSTHYYIVLTIVNS